MQPKRSIEVRKTDINAALRSTVLISSHFINRATEGFTFDEGHLPKVLGDSQRLQQVFLNLIRNACQSLSGPHEAIRIASRFKEEERMVEVIIESKKGEGTRVFVTLPACEEESKDAGAANTDRTALR
ncbi:MAG: hypothetical protein ACLFQW_03645 [Spirochaetaceae bacterium]